MDRIAKITLALLIAAVPALRSACLCCASGPVIQEQSQAACCAAKQSRGVADQSAPFENRASCPCPDQTIETAYCCATDAAVAVNAPMPRLEPPFDAPLLITSGHDVAAPTNHSGKRDAFQLATSLCAVTILHEHLLL